MAYLFCGSLLVLWFWMLVDCATCERNPIVKVLWLLVLLTGPLAGVIYYAIRALPRVIEEDSATPAAKDPA